MAPWVPDITGELRELLALAEENTGDPGVTMTVIRERCLAAGYADETPPVLIPPSTWKPPHG